MMNLALHLLLVLAALVLFSVSAAPASPQGEVYVQPDGTAVILFLKGDVHYSWMTDYDDYTVIKDDQNRYVYAMKIDGELVSSGVEAGRGDPTKLGVEPNLKTDPDKRPVDELDSEQDNRRRELLRNPPQQLCSHKATSSKPCKIRHLVVLVKFADHARRRLPDHKEYELLFNHNGRVEGNETLKFGSVADLFDVNSNGALRIETHVTPWIQSIFTEDYFVSTNYGKNLPESREGETYMSFDGVVLQSELF